MALKDIARIAGVSVSTASRVLNDPDYRCREPGVRERVWKAAMEQGYTANEAARNLKMGSVGGRVFYIDVLMSRMDLEQTDPFFSELLRVVESEIHRNLCILSHISYKPILSDDGKCAGMDLKKLVRETIEESDGHGDGLIVLGKCNPEALRLFSDHYKGIVSINRNSTNYEVDEVTCDGKKIAALAVSHLLSKGHKRIAYIGTTGNEARYDGFVETLEKHKLKIYKELIIEVHHTEKDGYRAMERICALNELPGAIYCANDIIAIGALKYLSTHRTPYYSPSIMGSDDIDEAQNTNPMLSTIRIPRVEMGRFAMHLLLDRLNGGHSSVTRIELEGKMMVRQT